MLKLIENKPEDWDGPPEPPRPITLYTKVFDIEEAIEYYCGRRGYTLIKRGEIHAVIQFNKCTLYLVEMGCEAEEDNGYEKAA